MGVLNHRRSGMRDSFRGHVGCFLLALVTAMGVAGLSSAQAGEAAFQTRCAACHSTGANRIVGPGLAGVTQTQDRAWLLRKITEPDRLTAEGDSRTQALVAEFGTPMPNMGVSRAEAESILDFLASGGLVEVVSPVAPQRPATSDDVTLGRELFQGTTRLARGGVACNACHGIDDAEVFGGGTLAIDLTGAHNRLGGPAVASMLQNPPFPVMRVAYEDRPLTDQEIAALTAFIEGASGDSTRNYAGIFVGSGVLGTLLLFGFFSLVWRGRRRESVNQSIYDRQIKSS
jgi:mono/diheme cytochrome c family protein